MNVTFRSLSSTLIAIGAAAALTTSAWAADAAAGKTLYASKCKSCHGADGTPPPAMAKAMGVKPLNDASVQSKSDADLKDAILKGVGKMKPQAVSPADADNLVAAVRTMK
ncbi:MAG TPA: cytochrome c [Bryobacteraceae bacterium]|nr:cytochrome c [Bryobacteraceae bacterium]